MNKVVRAFAKIDADTYRELVNAAKFDKDIFPTFDAALTYCLKLGIDSYLENQPDENRPATR